MGKGNKKIVIILLSLSLLIILSSTIIIILPLLREVNRQSIIFEENQYILGNLELAYSSFSENEEKLRHIETMRVQNQGNIPEFFSIADIILEIKEFNEHAKGSIEDLQFIVNGEYKGFRCHQLPIAISWKGNYENIISFIQAIEGSKRRYTIQSMTLENSWTSQRGSLRATILLNTFAVGDGDSIFLNPSQPVLEESGKKSIFAHPNL